MNNSNKIFKATLAVAGVPLLGLGAAVAQPEPASAVAQPESDDIDPMRGWDEEHLDVYAAYWNSDFCEREERINGPDACYDYLMEFADLHNLSQYEAKYILGSQVLKNQGKSVE